MTNKTPHQIIAGQSGSNCPCPRCSAGYAETVIAELEAEGWVIVRKHEGGAFPRGEDALASVQAGRCGCWACFKERGENPMHMVVCLVCGNKRCPKANDHRNACTNSNKPGQLGSAYA